MAAPVPRPCTLVRTVPLSSVHEVLKTMTGPDAKTQKAFKVGSPSEKDQKCSFPNCTTEINPALSLATCACEKVFCRAHRKPSEHQCRVSLRNMS